MFDFLRRKISAPPKSSIPQHPTLEEYDAIEALPGYPEFAEQIKEAQNLVSFTPGCLTNLAITNLAKGMHPSLKQMEHLETCVHCSGLLDVTRAHVPDPDFARVLAGISSRSNTLVTAETSRIELTDRAQTPQAATETADEISEVVRILNPVGDNAVDPTALKYVNR